MTARHLLLPLLSACLLAPTVGCSSIGPGTVSRDRYDYSGSVGESWKRQALLNVVKLRYLDPPTFVDVGQIVAGYSLETGLTGGATFPQTTAFGGNTPTVSGTARFTDRPTITYTPMTGNRFIKALLMPLPPESVFFLIQAGWPADGVLFASVASLNGLRNQSGSIAGVAPADPDFVRVGELLRRVQASGGVGMRIVQDDKKQQTTVLTFHTRGASEQTLADVRELNRLLGVDPDAGELRLVYGAAARNRGELAVQTRSVIQIMTALSSGVEVPAEHVAQGRAVPGVEPAAPAATAAAATTAPADRLALVRVHSGKREPADAYASIWYRGHWFWIDDADLRTKRNFAFLMMLFTLSDNGERESLPLITIPAQ
ncbi:MAG TPA: hypothetical protein VF796_22445 [Humisphaera sp.]